LKIIKTIIAPKKNRTIPFRVIRGQKPMIFLLNFGKILLREIVVGTYDE